MMYAARYNQLEVVRYLREVVGEDAATTNKVREGARVSGRITSAVV